MPKYYIEWSARGVQGYEVVEAANEQEAGDMVYELAREDFESQISTTVKTVRDAKLDGDLDDEEEDEDND